jgi:hypothetical protein
MDDVIHAFTPTPSCPECLAASLLPYHPSGKGTPATSAHDGDSACNWHDVIEEEQFGAHQVTKEKEEDN